MDILISIAPEDSHGIFLNLSEINTLRPKWMFFYLQINRIACFILWQYLLLPRYNVRGPDDILQMAMLACFFVEFPGLFYASVFPNVFCVS